MGDIAAQHVNNYLSGRWGVPLPKQREYPKTTKQAIAQKPFHIVKVTGHKTNRLPDSVLVVCDNTEDSFWVWASGGVTGIQKSECTVLEANLPLAEALLKTGRKAYGAPNLT